MSHSKSPCVLCEEIIADCQHKLCCDECSRWQRRLCNIGFNHTEYRRLIRGDIVIAWQCENCPQQFMSSSSPTFRQPQSSPSSPSSSPSSPKSLPSSPSSSTSQSPSSSSSSSLQSPPSSVQPSPPSVPASSSRRKHRIIAPRHTKGVKVSNISRSTSKQIAPIQDPWQELQLPDVIEEFPEDPQPFRIIEGGTQTGRQLLVENGEYSYTLKSRKPRSSGKVLWRCSIRTKACTCKATVTQQGETFTRGFFSHCHPSKPGIGRSIRVTKKVQKLAKENILRSAATIAKEVMKTEPNPDAPNQPKLANLVRSSNYQRQKQRSVKKC